MNAPRIEAQRLFWLAACIVPLACGKPRDRLTEPGPSVPPLQFETRRERALDGKPLHVLAEDLDGDGRADPVVALMSPGGLRYWNGASNMHAPTQQFEFGEYPLAPVALPSGTAGRQWLALASRALPEVLLVDLFTAGGPTVLMRLELPLVPRALAAGDLGADGSFEIVVVCDDRRLLIIDSVGEVEERALAHNLPRCVHVLADGSGVVVGYQDTRALEVLDVDPARASLEIELGGIPRALIELDLDGDGDLELAVGGGDRSIWVFGWNSTEPVGAWSAGPGELPLAWTTETIPIDLLAEDLDLDGRDELLTLAFHGLTWSVRSDFQPGGARHLRQDYAGQTPTSMATGDLDGDGRPELFVTARDTRSLSVFAGRGLDGFASAPRVPVGRFPSAIATGDFNGDGRPGAVVVCSKDETVRVVVGDEDGLRARSTLPAGSAPRAPRLGDLNGDGQLDLALLASGPRGTRLGLWLGSAAGQWGDPVEVAAGQLGSGGRDLLLVDPEGNGSLGFLIADEEGGRLHWIEDDSGPPRTLALSPAPRVLERLPLAESPAVVVAGLGGDQPALAFLVFEGEGEGEAAGWREMARQPLEWIPLDLEVADFDGDRRQDLVVLISPNPSAPRAELRVLLQRGTPTRPEWLPLPRVPTSGHPRGLAAADFDGDKRAEIVVPSQTGHVLDLWRMRVDGDSGEFRLEALDRVGAGVGPMAVALVDVDGDGRIDILAANGHSDDLSVILAR